MVYNLLWRKCVMRKHLLVISSVVLFIIMNATNAAYIRSDNGSIVRDNSNECWVDSNGLSDETNKRDLVACGAAKIVTKEKTVNLNGFIHFDLDSYALDKMAIKKLSGLVTKLRSLKEVGDVRVISVVGHTDATGDHKYNMGLGNLRANAVADYLQNHGFKVNTRLSIGENGLVVKTQQPNRVNRRVNIRVTYTYKKYIRTRRK
jgi:outer membrane protein OmpA-like peptidoglycan-associated protein